MPPEDYLEILRFRHYTHFWNFESKGKNSRRKSIINSIEVSVILEFLKAGAFFFHQIQRGDENNEGKKRRQFIRK